MTNKTSLDFIFHLTRKPNKTRLKQGQEMISANDTVNPFVKAEITAYLKSLARTHPKIRELKKKHPKTFFNKHQLCRVIIYVSSPDENRRGTPNWDPTVKPLIDGLVQAGILSDDSDAIIKKFHFEVDKIGLAPQKRGRDGKPLRRYQFRIHLETLEKETDDNKTRL